MRVSGAAPTSDARIALDQRSALLLAGLPDDGRSCVVGVEARDDGLDIHVAFAPATDCAGCGGNLERRRQRRSQARFRHTGAHPRTCLVAVSWAWRCPACGAAGTTLPDRLVEPGRRFTRSFARRLDVVLATAAPSQAAGLMCLSRSTVNDVVRGLGAFADAAFPPTAPRVLAADECYLGIMRVVLVDMTSKHREGGGGGGRARLVDVLATKRDGALSEYLERLPVLQRVEIFVADACKTLWAETRKGFERRGMLPPFRVLDLFHVRRSIYDHVEAEVRRLAGGRKGTLWDDVLLVVRRSPRISPAHRDHILSRAAAVAPGFQVAWVAAADAYAAAGSRDRPHAEARLAAFDAIIADRPDLRAALGGMAEFVQRHRAWLLCRSDPLVRESSLSTGPVERLNADLEALWLDGRGWANFDAFRRLARVRFAIDLRELVEARAHARPAFSPWPCGGALA